MREKQVEILLFNFDKGYKEILRKSLEQDYANP